MKIALISNASSIHTRRWANGLYSAGVEVHLISQNPIFERMASGVHNHVFPNRGVVGYFTMVPMVKRLLKEIRPDLVNAHYASGYGTTARFVAYRPLLLSVWGSDVYRFPAISIFHKAWVRRNLLAADAVASTSHSMARKVLTLAPELKHIHVTPFGVDTGLFDEARKVFKVRRVDSPIVIGTVKTMAPEYGIDILINAFALLRNRLARELPEMAQRVFLRLVGDGPQSGDLKQLANELNVGEFTSFVGHVQHDQVCQELGKIDVYVALSRSESFGVSVIEASAAARPVVVSDAGGLPEVVINGVTGLVVPRENPQAAADALLRLVLDSKLCNRLGRAGQLHVRQKYDWTFCVQVMLEAYRDTISRYSRGLGNSFLD